MILRKKYTNQRKGDNMKQIKIDSNFIKYDEQEVEAQSCMDDCVEVKYSKQASGRKSGVVGGPAITACTCSEVQHTQKTAKGNPFF